MGAAKLALVFGVLLCVSCASEPESWDDYVHLDDKGRWVLDIVGELSWKDAELNRLVNEMVAEMQEKELIGVNLFSIIADPEVEYERLLKAMLRLGPVTEEPTFWTRIANDLTYTERHRSLCAYQLCKRHVHAGMTLGELATMLHASGRPSWLRDDWFHRMGSGTGPAPRAADQRQAFFFSVSAYVRAPTPRLGACVAPEIYVGFLGERWRPVERDDFARLLCTGEGPQALRDVEITAVDAWPPHLVGGELLMERLPERGVDINDEVIRALLSDIYFFGDDWIDY